MRLASPEIYSCILKTSLPLYPKWNINNYILNPKLDEVVTVSFHFNRKASKTEWWRLFWGLTVIKQVLCNVFIYLRTDIILNILLKSIKGIVHQKWQFLLNTACGCQWLLLFGYEHFFKISSFVFRRRNKLVSHRLL